VAPPQRNHLYILSENALKCGLRNKSLAQNPPRLSHADQGRWIRTLRTWVSIGWLAEARLPTPTVTVCGTPRFDRDSEVARPSLNSRFPI
jgi:hypothetical protein